MDMDDPLFWQKAIGVKESDVAKNNTEAPLPATRVRRKVNYAHQCGGKAAQSGMLDVDGDSSFDEQDQGDEEEGSDIASDPDLAGRGEAPGSEVERPGRVGKEEEKEAGVASVPGWGVLRWTNKNTPLQIDVAGDTFVIGRERESRTHNSKLNLALPREYRTVSGTHCEHVRGVVDGVHVLHDMSTNGTWVNGKRVAKNGKVDLNDGAQIALGRRGSPMPMFVFRRGGSGGASSEPVHGTSASDDWL